MLWGRALWERALWERMLRERMLRERWIRVFAEGARGLSEPGELSVRLGPAR